MFEIERCDPDRECRLRETIGCREDVHHEYYPRREVLGRGVVAAVFRELPENKTVKCRDAHNERHCGGDEAPAIPDNEIMLLAILEAINRGQLVLHGKKKTRIGRMLADD